MYVVTAEEMGNIDKRAIEEYKIPGIVLMENAALRSVDIIEQEYDIYGKNIIVLAGGGNNGGDGLAIARHLHLDGANVEIFAVFSCESARGDAKTNLEGVKALSIPITYVLNRENVFKLENSLKDGDIVIDALFGTGLSHEVEGIAGDMIDIVNAWDIPVVSIDMPSGIHGSNGYYMGKAISASHTITFGYPKRGHYLYPGREYSGELHVVPISLPTDSARAIDISAYTLDDIEVATILKDRPNNSHKGTFGRVGVIAGSTGLTGAAYLTSLAAQRTGAGLVTLAVPYEIQPIMAEKLTEVMTHPLDSNKNGCFSLEAASEAIEFSKDKDV